MESKTNDYKIVDCIRAQVEQVMASIHEAKRTARTARLQGDHDTASLHSEIQSNMKRKLDRLWNQVNKQMASKAH